MKNLPSGLDDNTLEIYRCKSGKVKALMNGNSVSYIELPGILREPFQAELIGDRAAINCLRNEMKITDSDEMEEKFVSCRYGALDSSPDFDGKITRTDAPVCDCIKYCKGFNVVCKVPAGKNGTLGRSEYMVATLVAMGKQDKEIAAELSIELPTVRTHLNRIREKLCVNNRIEIADWVQSHGIV